MAFAGAGKIRREPCAKCGLPVFIAERLNVGKQLYHRTCFRCARCSSQLTLANYYETENNQFCCETCPDEEKNLSVLTKSLSDEEKSASLTKQQEIDEYSTNFESALEYPTDPSLKTTSTITNSQFKEARSFFISSQVENAASVSSDSGNEEEPPDLPKSKPPVLAKETFSDSSFPTTIVNRQSSLVSASGKLEKSHDIVTKDTISAEGNTNSLVKARMRLFETKSDAPNETHSINTEVPSTDDSSCVQAEVGEEKIEEIEETIDDNVTSNQSSNFDSIKIEEKTAINTEDESVITISDSDDKISITSPPQNVPSLILIPDVSETTSPPDVKLPLSPDPQVDKSILIEEYPDDLNPFGDDEEQASEQIPNKLDNSIISSNPFEDEEDEDICSLPSPKPAIRKKLRPTQGDKNIPPRHTLNPFEDDEDDEPKEKPPEPAKRHIIPAPKISLNPFWSDDDEKEDDKPVPKPRTSK